MSNQKPSAGLATVLAVTVVLCSCETGADLAPTSRPSIREVTTGSAQLALDAHGQFVFPDPPAVPGAPPQISQAVAGQLARAWAVSIAPMVQAGLEADRGDSLTPASLLPCLRPLYAKSPYLPPPPDVSGTPGGAVVLRAFGPYWLITLCKPTGEPAVLLAVSVYSTDLTVSNDQITFPLVGGEWFHWKGIAKGQASELPIGSERAAILSYLSSGKRVAATPELLVPARSDGFPYDARWRLPLEAPASVALESGPSRLAAEMYVGWSPIRTKGVIALSSADQPATLDARYVLNPTAARGTPRQYAIATLPRGSDTPVAFDVVTTDDKIPAGGH